MDGDAPLTRLNPLEHHAPVVQQPLQQFQQHHAQSFAEAGISTVAPQGTITLRYHHAQFCQQPAQPVTDRQPSTL